MYEYYIYRQQQHLTGKSIKTEIIFLLLQEVKEQLKKSKTNNFEHTQRVGLNSRFFSSETKHSGEEILPPRFDDYFPPCPGPNAPIRLR